MLNKPAALTASRLPDMIALPRAEAELLLSVFRAARKYHNILRGNARGDAATARGKLLDLVKEGGDPAKPAVAALIDGGSSGSMESDVVSAGGVFKDSGRKQNSRMVMPARTGAVAESRPASFGRKSSLFTSGPAALCGEHAAGPLFPVTLSPVSNASHAPEVAALGCATAWRFRAKA